MNIHLTFKEGEIKGEVSVLKSLKYTNDADILFVIFPFTAVKDPSIDNYIDVYRYIKEDLENPKLIRN